MVKEYSEGVKKTLSRLNYGVGKEILKELVENEVGTGTGTVRLSIGNLLSPLGLRDEDKKKGVYYLSKSVMGSTIKVYGKEGEELPEGYMYNEIEEVEYIADESLEELKYDITTIIENVPELGYEYTRGKSEGYSVKIVVEDFKEYLEETGYNKDTVECIIEKNSYSGEYENLGYLSGGKQYEIIRIGAKEYIGKKIK